jgi:predicted pyridoxine 5'-phosphate oxidase superfamily flavin-nucleotide-binding protein
MFTPAVKRVQEDIGSRMSYARLEGGDKERNRLLGQGESRFIAERDSFYMASVGETGWPYLQHRGGPPGFVRMLDERTIGFADFRGNRQYVTVGNIAGNDRVSLFFMDYASQTRLKLLGRVRLVAMDDRDVIDRLPPAGTDARVERGILITVEAFDWNCSQHITPRYTAAEVEAAITGLRQRIADLETALREAMP